MSIIYTFFLIKKQLNIKGARGKMDLKFHGSLIHHWRTIEAKKLEFRGLTQEWRKRKFEFISKSKYWQIFFRFTANLMSWM